jgi:enoyl-CoA hydratase/carnithine racemase
VEASNKTEEPAILFTYNSKYLCEVILNRPKALNALTTQSVLLLLREQKKLVE